MNKRGVQKYGAATAANPGNPIISSSLTIKSQCKLKKCIGTREYIIGISGIVGEEKWVVLTVCYAMEEDQKEESCLAFGCWWARSRPVL